MIIRESGDHLLLITQPDHAALAGVIVDAWQADGLPASPRRDVVVFATAHHDDGWIEVDGAPVVDGSNGRLLDFINAPDDTRWSVWPRAVERLGANPYVAALVAEHSLRIHAPSRDRPEAGAFFSQMETLRERVLSRSRPLTQADVDRDYFFVRMGDTLSLTFCNGWVEPRRQGRYEIRLKGARLTIDPDPFDGAELPLRVRARKLANRPYSAREAADAFQSAPVVMLSGVASGPDAPSGASRPRNVITAQ